MGADGICDEEPSNPMTRKRFKKVGVLMGGPSREREVSLHSGRAVVEALRTAGYDVAAIDLKDRELDLPTGIEAVFVALHGEFGEDGQVQALLKQRQIPYTGSGPEASRRSFDKRLSKKIFVERDIPTPPFEILRAGQGRTLPLPVVVKPVRQGSSIGVHILFHESDWPRALNEALSYDGEVLVETYIEGRELTVGLVVEQVLPVIEIKAPGGFYNYKAKYTQGLTQYIVPAEIPPDRAAECQRLALRTFQAMNCRDMGRVDFRMLPAGELFVLELNNIPGFTGTSLLPKAAHAAGIEFPELCSRILSMASVH
jgi:D-alanine-D-alanine ligase